MMISFSKDVDFKIQEKETKDGKYVFKLSFFSRTKKIEAGKGLQIEENSYFMWFSFFNLLCEQKYGEQNVGRKIA